MTETTTIRPVKRVRKVNPPPPAFDFTALKPAATTPPRRKAGSIKGPNPTIPWVRESWEKRSKVGNTELGEGKKVTIPSANLQQFRNLLNYAARDLNLGVTIDVGKVAKGQVDVTFAAKTRNKKKEKPTVPVAPPAAQ